VTIELAVVDGPNLFNRVGSLLRKTLDDRLRDDIKPYLVDWFDLDRMLMWHLDLAPAPALDTRIVYSERALGHDPYRLSQEETRRFWRRQAALPGCHSVPISIPTDHQEVYDGACAKCGTPVELRSKDEKGVDVAVASELFTRGPWSRAALVSTDTDLAPAVDALAKLNRHVVCLGTSAQEPTALHVQASEFRELDPEWWHGDFATYRLARRGGVLDSLTTLLGQHQLTFAFQWMSDIEVVGVRYRHRVQLGIWHPGRSHSDIVSQLAPAKDNSGYKDAVDIEARNEEITIIHSIPSGAVRDLGAERRMKLVKPRWADHLRRGGVFDVVYPHRSR
jgi:uncharacterized LabA/DUF88 family protein